MVRAVDHEIAAGVFADMTEHGWERDERPAIFEHVMARRYPGAALPDPTGEKSSVCTKVIKRLYGNNHLLNDLGPVGLLRPRRRLDHHRQRGQFRADPRDRGSAKSSRPASATATRCRASTDRDEPTNHQRVERVGSQQPLAVPLREQLQDEQHHRLADLRDLDPQPPSPVCTCRGRNPLRFPRGPSDRHSRRARPTRCRTPLRPPVG